MFAMQVCSRVSQIDLIVDFVICCNILDGDIEIDYFSSSFCFLPHSLIVNFIFFGWLHQDINCIGHKVQVVVEAH